MAAAPAWPSAVCTRSRAIGKYRSRAVSNSWRTDHVGAVAAGTVSLSVGESADRSSTTVRPPPAAAMPPLPFAAYGLGTPRDGGDAPVGHSSAVSGRSAGGYRGVAAPLPIRRLV